MAYHRRQDAETNGNGIGGIDPGDVVADDTPYETCAIVARDGVHTWNQTAAYLPRSDLDLNDINAPDFVLSEHFEYSTATPANAAEIGAVPIY